MFAFYQIAFIEVLNMSITASFAILLVLPARLLLTRLPKRLSYGLWAIVFIRLFFPFSFSSPFSFLWGSSDATGKMQYIPSNIAIMNEPRISSGSAPIDASLNPLLPPATPLASANPLQISLSILTLLWLLGIALLLLHGSLSWMKLRRRTQTAMLVNGNIYESEKIPAPFIMGIFHPKIYLPIGADLRERSFYLAHEKAHIRHFDHLLKPLAGLAACIHWFNPLVWLALHLLNRDIEMDCDESVLNELGAESRADYCDCLLSLASAQHPRNLIPAFGEGSIEARIKNILRYRKASIWKLLAALLFIAAVLFGLLSNPLRPTAAENFDFSEEIYLYRTPYVGDNSKVVHLADMLPFPPDFVRGPVELFTDQAPYKLDISYQASDQSCAYYDTPQNQSIFDRNAILLFALIGNASEASFTINCDSQQIVIERSRDRADESMQQDVWTAASDFASFQALNRDLIQKYPQNEVLYALLSSGKTTARQSTNDVPAVAQYTRLEIEGETWFVYFHSGRYYVEKPYRFIDEISSETWRRIQALTT